MRLKISHKLILLALITGLGYLGLSWVCNQVQTQGLTELASLTRLQGILNELLLTKSTNLSDTGPATTPNRPAALPLYSIQLQTLLAELPADLNLPVANLQQKLAILQQYYRALRSDQPAPLQAGSLTLLETDVLHELQALRQQTDSRITANFKQQQVFYYAATGIWLVLSLLVATALARGISQPLQRLAMASRALAQGIWSRRIDVDSLPADEFGEVATAFNQMAERIESHHQDLENHIRERTEALVKVNTTLSREARQRRSIETALERVADTVLSRTGSQYFQSFVRYLTVELGFDYAAIYRLSDIDSATTLAWARLGQMQAPRSFKISGSPLERVLNQTEFLFADGLDQRFPNDPLVQEFSIRSFLGTPVRDTQGHALGLVAVMHCQPMPATDTIHSILRILVSHVGAEIEREQQNKALQMSEARTRILVEHAPEAIVLFDASNGRFIEVNLNAERLYGLSRQELAELTPADVSPPFQPNGQPSAELARYFIQQAINGEAPVFEWLHKRSDGSTVECEVRLVRLPFEDAMIVRGSVTDISERKRTEQRLQHLAYHDILTDLPNRLLLMERIGHAIDTARRHSHQLAVMFLDLDRFKNINDTLGHDVGDELLRQIAQRLKQQLRSSDTVARLGGDEFAILLEETEASADVAATGAKIIESFSRPFPVNEHELFLTTSIGISLFPNDGDDALALVKNADAAMYRAKDQGRNMYCFYSAELTVKAYRRLALETQLRRALELGEFELFFQSQYRHASCPDGSAAVTTSTPAQRLGAEALIRWRQADQTLVSPAEFIPVLEETGMIIPVGEWVISEACRHILRWQQQGIAPESLALNISGRQFNDNRLVAKIEAALQQSGLSPELLELEITESVIIREPEQAIRQLQQLSELGVRIAIDDFGTGYSSLSYLKHLPIAMLKIDRSFVRDITHDPDDAAIVEAIIAMARSLKLEVIAEGVETQEQCAILSRLGCYWMQGFLFDRPMSGHAFEQLLRQDQRS